MVGTTARRRVSSVTAPPSVGAFKSARRKMRLPGRSSCSIVSFATASGTPSERLCDEADEVAHPRRVSPLVVVTGDNLYNVAVEESGQRQIEVRRERLSV